jgi:hypothetical protein
MSLGDRFRSLPPKGEIKQSQVIAEFGKGDNLISYLGEGGVTSSAPLKLTDFYGTSSGPAAEWDTLTYTPAYGHCKVPPGANGSGGTTSYPWNCSAVCQYPNGSAATYVFLISNSTVFGGYYTLEYDFTLSLSGTQPAGTVFLAGMDRRQMVEGFDTLPPNPPNAGAVPNFLKVIGSQIANSNGRHTGSVTVSIPDYSYGMCIGVRLASLNNLNNLYKSTAALSGLTLKLTRQRRRFMPQTAEMSE